MVLVLVYVSSTFVWHETRFVESGIFNDSEPIAFTRVFTVTSILKWLNLAPDKYDNQLKPKTNRKIHKK